VGLAFPKTFYAVKAFSAHAMLRLAADEGLDLLAASGGEVEACVRAGVAPARIALHGRNKSDEELELAIRVRVGLLIADGLDELRRLDALAGAAGVVQPFLLRVNPGVRVDTHESIATGHESTAFGVPAVAAPATVAAAASFANVRFLGVHAHIGSQVPDVEPFMRELDVLVALTDSLRQDHGIAVEMLDMGGGFAITYTDERTPSIADIAAAAELRLRVGCGELGLGADARGGARPQRGREPSGHAVQGGLIVGRSATAGPWSPSTGGCRTTSGRCSMTRDTRWRRHLGGVARSTRP
jgi:diaminopimelate decarboxylase